MNNMINNRNNIPAYAKVSLEKLRCNNIGPKQLQQQPPFPTMFVPYQLQQPAWIYCHQDETQTYSVPGHPQMSTNKYGPPKPVSNLPGVGSRVEVTSKSLQTVDWANKPRLSPFLLGCVPLVPTAWAHAPSSSWRTWRILVKLQYKQYRMATPAALPVCCVA